MLFSDDISELAAAMAKAQAEIENPAKDKMNPHFKSRYADIASGLLVIRPALSKHGIAFFQITDTRGPDIVLFTRLVHSSGQWVQGEMPVCKAGTPPQQVGAAMTYIKRVALFAIVGVAGEDDDDDGNQAQEGAVRQQDGARAMAWKMAEVEALKGVAALRSHYKAVSPEARSLVDWGKLHEIAEKADGQAAD